jgi:hypothetical protein
VSIGFPPENPGPEQMVAGFNPFSSALFQAAVSALGFPKASQHIPRLIHYIWFFYTSKFNEVTI